MNYVVNDFFSVFVRQDNKDPDTDVNNNTDDTTMAGFIWTPTKGLAICPNVVKGNERINFEFKF